MSMGIERQSQQYAAWDGDAAVYAVRDRTSGEHDASIVADMLNGPSIHAGLNNPRKVAGPYDAYHEYPTSPDVPATHDAPAAYSDEQEAQGELAYGDEQSGYNWGPEPGYDPGAEPGPHPDFHGDAPQPFGTPVYNPKQQPSFRSARDGGPAITALALPPAQPAAPAAPVWLGHTFAPAHRVELPWKDQSIQGTVTHLEGTNVGVRWDDGQHSIEEPSAIRPLY